MSVRRRELFKYLNVTFNFIEILPDEKKEMLSYSGLIYQKYVSKFDRLLSFIFEIDVFHLVWEYPNGKRYYDWRKIKEV